LVKDVEITPHSPRPGDPVKITFHGECGERFPVELIYEQTVPAASGAFSVQMNEILVPWPRNSLAIDARYVTSMNVGAKFFLWISKKADVVDGVGSYQLKDVPEGNYSVRLNGIPVPGAREVKVRITAQSELRTDASGTCSYRIQTAPQNSGNLIIKCSGLENRIEIANK
jgi:hypothetical protein